MNSTCNHPNVLKVFIYVLMKLIIICAAYFIIFFNKLFMSYTVNRHTRNILNKSSIWCSAVRDGEKKPNIINIHWKSLSAVTHSHGDSFLSSDSKCLPRLSDISCYFQKWYPLDTFTDTHMILKSSFSVIPSRQDPTDMASSNRPKKTCRGRYQLLNWADAHGKRKNPSPSNHWSKGEEEKSVLINSP